MKPGIPWSVKGIEPEVREAAKSAARRAGLTVGEWLNSVILDQNEQIDSLGAAITGHLARPSTPPAAAAPAPRPARPEPPREEASRQEDSALRLQDIARQLSALAQKERDSAPFEPPVPAPARIEEEEAFARLLERIDDNERQTVEALSAVNERLSVLAQQLAGLPRAPRYERPEDVPGYAMLEAAIRNVVEHIAGSERRSRDALSDIQNRLSALAEQATRRAEHDEPRAAALVADLDRRVADVASRLQRTERLVQAGIPEDVRRELSDLGHRMEDVRSESAATLRESEARILARLKDVEVQQGQSATLSDVGQMRGEIGSLSRLIEEVGDAAASERDIQALRVALEQLSARVAQGPDLRPLAEMDRRLTEMGRRLEGVSEIEHRVASLDERLEEVLHLQSGHPVAMGVMEQNLASFGERVGRTEQQLRHIETMEHAIRQLFDSLEQSRDENNRAAEEAASRAAEEAAGRAVARAMSLSVPQSGPSPELKALEQGLQAVRDSAAAADRRNQQTLGAVQETLAQIVAKIAQLESSPPAAALQTAPEAAAPAQGTAAGAVLPERPEPDADEEALQAEPATAQPSLAAGDDFIAAARRAAQAAASRPSALRAEYGPLAQQPEKKQGFSFLKRSRKADAVSAAAPAPGQSQRKRLLLAGIVLLTAVSAFAFTMLVKSVPGTAPAVIDQPAAAKKSSLVPDEGSAPKAVPAPAPAANALPVPDVGTEALRKAAADGNPSAQYVVASRYLNGVGVPQDLDKAVFWSQQAAAKGYAPAQYLLGTLYERGLGAPKDAAKALEWYGKAAALGNVSSMHNAAVLLSSEQAGKPDYDRAFTLFTSAARHGLRDSQFNLAVFHERGLGTTADPAEAYFWYRLAAQQGDSQAAERATALTKTLAPDTLSKLTKRLAGFVPAPANDGANVVAVLDPAWQDPQGAVLASGAAVPLTAVAPAASSTDIEEVQRLLSRAGFSVGTPDGKMNSRTSSAIRLFQLQAGMKVTGEVTPELLAALRAKGG